MARSLSAGISFAAVAIGFALASNARAEPPACLSADPKDWPAASRPYFMLAVDTSGSMVTKTGNGLNSCGLPERRYTDAKCALQQAVTAFSGQVNFGLATFATRLWGCGDCDPDCNDSFCLVEDYDCNTYCFAQEPGCLGCGPRPGGAATRAGAFIRVPMQQDAFWTTPSASNVGNLLAWVDGKCDGDAELYARGGTPLNGILRDMRRYFASGWTAPDGSVSYPTPLSEYDLTGAGVNGSTGCRSVNVILLTDGDESCDSQNDAVAAAAELFQQGVTVSGKTFKIRTHVINFAGATPADADAIAAAGGTGASLFAGNEVELSQALGSIISNAVSPEVCDNIDNNCNGCTDEGYKRYCNVQQDCCSWSTQSQRQQCLQQYRASVEQSPPHGDLSLLPCTTVAQQSQPATWLCVDPGDQCDAVDNNCQGGVDEGQLTCGNPPHCPTAEVCNGQDDDCDGQIDEGVCSGCVPSAEVCDGCDNDCDGIIDNPPPGGFDTAACGLPNPPNCQGTMSCQPPQAAPTPGACLAGAGYGSCGNSPSAEVCDGVDNDCDGAVDEDIAQGACDPEGNPSGLVYGGASQCTQGSTQCIGGKTVCVGGTGPSIEVCDGIDNDCDGQVDEDAFGTGQPCGPSSPPCSPGTTQCVGGVLVCSGGVQPASEICDGIDNDCDGQTDEGPLSDGPNPGETGCWNEPGNCCSHENLEWCPPDGADCHGPGNLTAPCAQGTLKCDGASGWVCAAPKPPAAETCDGIDNDCNGNVDDGALPGVGAACGLSVGACKPGTMACTMGTLDCVGDVGPTQEICDGIDNDCDGQIDNGIPSNGSCTMPYDESQFPGDRSGLPCQPGVLECDGSGSWVCSGGVGPMAEVCDGIDNDCDGKVDENGAAPDGIDGSANPFPPPNASIGDACGSSVGLCAPGTYACNNGSFACVGAQAPVVETCDCSDNDCDGEVDELAGPGEPPLCSPGKDCVKSDDECQCAAPCGKGEFPCPPGQICKTVPVSGSGEIAAYCVVDYTAMCGDCASKTVENDGKLECAPAGTDPAGCLETPQCQYKQQNGCRAPCFGVECGPGKVCAEFGPNAGACVEDSCYLTLCGGCDQVCHAGECVKDPCAGSPCGDGEACKPSSYWSGYLCVPSCAGVSCAQGEKCVDGACKPTCDPECPSGQVCDADADGGPTCVASKCDGVSCPGGAYCEPLTGECGDPPCQGVVCPEGQACVEGSCAVDDSEGQGGGSGSAGEGGSSVPVALQDIATEESGCACAVEVGSSRSGSGDRLWLLAAAASVVLGLRRRRVSSLLAVLASIAAGGCAAGSELDGVEDRSTTGVGGGDGAGGGDGIGGGLLIESGAGGGGTGVEGCVLTNGGVESCDGVDNDCDGEVDEGFDLASITRCGTCDNSCFASLLNTDPTTIACEWDGTPGKPGTCSFGACASDYHDLDPSKPGCEYYCVVSSTDDTACNNRDDDCDGKIDEDVDFCTDTANCGQCGRSCNAVHGTAECVVLDENKACDKPNTACKIAACDDVDGDGSPDFWDLDGSYATGCEYACSITNGGVEICDGIDNDCDGKIDAADDLSGDPAVGAVCYGDPDGLCATPEHAGVTACQGGKVVCTGSKLLVENQKEEICNGVDDDCDGVVDDSPKDAGGYCGKSNVAPCSFGTEQCIGGVLVCQGAIDPQPEMCDGIDNDCDGVIDSSGGMPPPDAVGACDVPTPPPAGATTPCVAGQLACVGGSVQCVGAKGPTGALDACGDDSNCDGKLENQPSLMTSTQHCGACGNDCSAGAEHATFACTQGKCVFVACEAGYHDLDGDGKCEYLCIPNGSEICDGIDNDCNGVVDDVTSAPPATQVCGVSPAAKTAECTSGVTVTCKDGAWQCSFPQGVCDPTCAQATEICDGLDNDCDGGINENVPNWGQSCFSDDGLPFPGHGACRAAGTYVCDGANATKCDAVKASCADLEGGCDELCDGVDNDCDGLVDETFIDKGPNADFFVKPAVTRIGTSLWMMSYEASRPDATATSPGSGNGYHCGQGECSGLPATPAGVPLDETIACSAPGRLPWFNVTPIEAEQTCDAIGGRLCDVSEWQGGCGATAGCSWAYAPRGAACTSPATGSKYCNLSGFDLDPSKPGYQNGLLVTASSALESCAGDFTGLYGNITASLWDLTGNLREIARGGHDDYRLMGGAFNAIEAGSTCGFAFYSVAPSYKLYDTGFRCCFDVDPGE